MTRPWPDYDATPLEIWEDPSFSVYDPWQAQVLGVFPTREAAETFMKAVYYENAEEQLVEPEEVAAAEFYIDKAGEHRWHIRSGNGKIIAASTEGYMNKSDAEKNFISVCKQAGREVFRLAQ